MEDQVITSTTEPTIVESANTSAQIPEAQVIENATPMDANVTYSSLAKEDYNPNMSVTQNLINKAVQTEHVVNQETNAGKAMNSFLTQGYDYDKNEAGSYWVAGAINDNNTQMSFLETLINEEMYDEMDLQKYYYDTNLATARAYAAQKGKETAYGFYRAAQERALAEGELTGWYMPAEGRYLLGQYTVAQNTLENPDATPEEISKANRVAKAAESWFSANQITTRGIKCLAMMNYEENVRHNNVMAALQKQANDIAGANAAASAASSKFAELEFRFKVEEEEMDKGVNFSYLIGLDDDAEYIGHKQEDYPNAKYLRGYDNAKSMLQTDTEHFAMVNTYASPAYIKGILGDDYYDAHIRYKNDVSLTGHKADIEVNKGITAESPGFTSTNKKTTKGNEVVYTVVGGEVVVGYFDDGVWVPITDKNATFSDDKKIKDFIENQFGEDSMSTKGVNSVTIDGEKYYFGRASTSENSNSYTNLVESGYSKGTINNNSMALNEKGMKEVDSLIKKSQSEKGVLTKDGKEVRNLKYKSGYIDKKNVNEYIILEGEDGEYYAPEQKVSGKWQLKKLDKHNIKEIESASSVYKVGDVWNGDGSMFGDNDKAEVAKASWYMGTGTDGVHYMYVPKGEGYEIVGIKSNLHEKYSPGKSWYDVVSINPDYQTLKDAGINLPKGTTSESYDGSKSATTTKDIAQSTKITTGSSYASATPSVNLNEYKPENTKATYNKYEIDTDGSPVLATLNEKEREDLQKNKINKVVI
jgi:hypothetical protein